VGAGWRQENASNQNLKLFRFDSIETEKLQAIDRAIRQNASQTKSHCNAIRITSIGSVTRFA
jgi:hypothetical protein